MASHRARRSRTARRFLRRFIMARSKYVTTAAAAARALCSSVGSSPSSASVGSPSGTSPLHSSKASSLASSLALSMAPCSLPRSSAAVAAVGPRWSITPQTCTVSSRQRACAATRSEPSAPHAASSLCRKAAHTLSPTLASPSGASPISCVISAREATYSANACTTTPCASDSASACGDGSAAAGAPSSVSAADGGLSAAAKAARSTEAKCEARWSSSASEHSVRISKVVHVSSCGARLIEWRSSVGMARNVS
mmetsp:Transcript_38505/g.106284  ORF Transcript_38505/g.106284 Transcript_38505/m.106284 type:complete len:253 (+) Transcript_38505:131-889(+)